MAITYVGAGAAATQSTAATNISVAYPSSILPGDYLVLDVGTSVATIPGQTAASGFTRLFTNSANLTSPSQGIYGKVATGSETGNLSVTITSGTSNARMYAYRGVDQVNPLDTGTAVWAGGSATTAYIIASQTPTMLGVSYHLFAVSNGTGGSFTPPSGYTELTDVSAVGPGNWAAHLLDVQNTNATGTRTVTRSASLRGAAMSIALRPAVSVPFAGWGVPI